MPQTNRHQRGCPVACDWRRENSAYCGYIRASLQGQVGIDLARVTQGRAALVIKELNAEARVDGGLIRIGNRTGDLVVTEASK